MYEAKKRTGIIEIPRDVPHIHPLTERYQELAQFGAAKEDGYAEFTDKFSTPDQAFLYFLRYCSLTFDDVPYESIHPLLSKDDLWF